MGTGKIGDDGKKQPLEVKKGDRVLFGKYAGTEIQIGMVYPSTRWRYRTGGKGLMNGGMVGRGLTFRPCTAL